MPLRHWKTVLLWISGSIAIFIGSMIAGRLDFGLGVNEPGFLLALVISLMFFLMGGLLWISVALAVKTPKH